MHCTKCEATNTHSFNRENDKGPTPSTLCDHRKVLGVDGAEAGVMSIAGDAQIFIGLLLAERTTVHMAELGRADLKGHLVRKREANKQKLLLTET